MNNAMKNNCPPLPTNRPISSHPLSNRHHRRQPLAPSSHTPVLLQSLMSLVWDIPLASSSHLSPLCQLPASCLLTDSLLDAVGTGWQNEKALKALFSSS